MTNRIVMPDGDDSGRLGYVLDIELSARRAINVAMDDAAECPLVHADIEALGLKKAKAADVSRILGKTMLEAARIVYILEQSADRGEFDMRLYNAAYWEGSARSEDDDTPAPDRSDPTTERRNEMRAVLAKTATSKDALVEQFGVSDRTVDGDLKALGATVVGKDGRKQLWGVGGTPDPAVAATVQTEGEVQS